MTRLWSSDKFQGYKAMAEGFNHEVSLAPPLGILTLVFDLDENGALAGRETTSNELIRLLYDCLFGLPPILA